MENGQYLENITQEILLKFFQMLTGKNTEKLLDTDLPFVELEDSSISRLELQINIPTKK